jgi:hypothetical protein
MFIKGLHRIEYVDFNISVTAYIFVIMHGDECQKLSSLTDNFSAVLVDPGRRGICTGTSFH